MGVFNIEDNIAELEKQNAIKEFLPDNSAFNDLLSISMKLNFELYTRVNYVASSMFNRVIKSRTNDIILKLTKFLCAPHYISMPNFVTKCKFDRIPEFPYIKYGGFYVDVNISSPARDTFFIYDIEGKLTKNNLHERIFIEPNFDTIIVFTRINGKHTILQGKPNGHSIAEWMKTATDLGKDWEDLAEKQGYEKTAEHMFSWFGTYTTTVLPARLY